MLSLRIALKFHRSYKKNFLMSIMSIIAIISIIIGTSVAIITLSVINGFEYELDKRILSIIPHGEIIPINTPFSNWESILNKIKKMPGLVDANPYINLHGIIEFNNKWHLVYIKSVNLIKNNNIYNNYMVNFVEKRAWQYFCKYENQIILGKNVSDNLNIKIGDWINIFFVYDGNNIHKLSSFKKIQVQVSGVLNLNSQFDSNLAIISLSNAKSYCNNKIDVDGIEIIVNNVFRINQIIKKLENKFHGRFQIYSWMDTYGYIYHDIQIIRLIIYLSVILIIGISCFNIIATLILSIKNKNYDIAILRAMGARSIFVRNIFLWHGFMMYLVASILGITIGIFISLNLTKIIKYINIFGIHLFPKGIYFIDFIPSKYNRLDVYIILGIIFLLGILTSWFASFKTNQTKFNHILK